MQSDNETSYPFPRGRVQVAAVADYRDTFRLRVAWRRGRKVLPLFETTPLRPIAEVTYREQTFSLAISGHGRERRERVLFTAERQADREGARLCGELRVAGREDRLTWTWRIALRTGARRRLAGGQADLCLHLPLPPGKVRILTLAGLGNGFALWRDGVVTTVVSAGGADEPLRADPCGVHLRVPRAALNGKIVARLETFFTAAATEQEARAALLRHLAESADRAQRAAETPPPPLHRIADAAAAALMAEDAADRHGASKLVLRAPDRSDLHLCGEGADAALVAHALHRRYRLTGDDAERRRALLLVRGVCDFGLVDEQSPHWGAIWDALRARRRFEDARGERTLSVATTARAAFGLLQTDVRFGQEVLTRTALAACQWLLLRNGAEGGFAGERYFEDGAPVPDGSPWVMGEALRPLVEAYRRTENAVFMKAALRVARGLREGVEEGKLSLPAASAEHLAAAVEGLVAISCESEKAEMIALARMLGWALRARRTPDGALSEQGVPCVPATLAAARGALALARVDDDPGWALLALRGLRAAVVLAEGGAPLRPAEHGALLALPTHLLLTLATRAPQTVADPEALTVTRGWQVFEPDPSTREFITVTTADGAPVDHLALVCPMNQQVLLVALAGGDAAEVVVHKNHRRPFLKNLLTGDYAAEARLLPLAPGSAEASLGIFLADT